MATTSSLPSPLMSAATSSWQLMRADVESLEGLGPGLARVAIPRSADELVDPAVAVDVEGGAADVGLGALAQVMLNPLVRPGVLEPPRPGPFADDPVEVAVLVEIDERGLAHLVADLGDLVILEPRHRGVQRAGDNHQR